MALLIVLSLAFLEQEIQAGQIQFFTVSLISTQADAVVSDPTVGVLDRQIQEDTFEGPFAGISRSNNFHVMNTVGGFNLSSSVSSQFFSNSNLIQISGQGSSFSDIQNADPNLNGATSSLYITNLKFFVDETTIIDWMYTAAGSPGPFGSSDGIDMRIRIRQWSDSSFIGTPLAIVTAQSFGAGSATDSFVLSPGFYQFILQGRVLYSSGNAANRDGQATWSSLIINLFDLIFGPFLSYFFSPVNLL